MVSNDHPTPPCREETTRGGFFSRKGAEEAKNAKDFFKENKRQRVLTKANFKEAKNFDRRGFYFP